VVAVPDRLEHAVGEAQHQNVLHRLLAEIVIDPVNLVFIDELEQFAVQRPRGSQIGAERLFHHQPPPRAVLGQHSGAAKLAADWQERVGRGRQIEQPVAAGVSRGFQFAELLAHRIEGSWIFRIGLDAGEAFQEMPRNRLVHLLGRELMQAFHQAVA